MLILYLALFYAVINITGYLIEKLRIPKIYAALFLGVLLSNSTHVTSVVETAPIEMLSAMGMFTLLFLLGYGLDINKIKHQSKLIFKITAYVILSEFLVGATILHYIFHVDLILAAVIAVSFATVGEVALLPLLKEFKILNTFLGQTILGVAVLDDVFEILAFVVMVALIKGLDYSNLVTQLLPLVAILTGMLVKNFVKPRVAIEKLTNVCALWIFGPIFFFTAGNEADLKLLVDNFLVIILFTLIIKITKISSAVLASHKQMGAKKSIVLGVSLGIKFSTSIVILIILLQNSLISQELFSILIGIKIMFKFVVPIILAILLSKWQMDLVADDNSAGTVPALETS